MKTKIKFYDIVMEEEVLLDIQDIETIEEGENCIIIINNDDLYFETHEIKFI